MSPQAVLESYDRAALWPLPDGKPSGTDLAAAYQAQLAVRALRLARGEKTQGYKIGFTNRTIWERYGVFAPIWGPVWDTTVSVCVGQAAIDLTGTCQPRLEPEIVFGVCATPPPGASLEEVFACVDWLAPGFEIVQSHCKDWKFTAPDTVLDGALHARLLIGRRTPVRRFAPTGALLDELLARTRVRLYRGETLVESGVGVNVLDGPLHALRHLVVEMQRCPGALALQPGEVVTTGTWTDAWPPRVGEVWRSEFDAPFEGLQATFV